MFQDAGLGLGVLGSIIFVLRQGGLVSTRKSILAMLGICLGPWRLGALFNTVLIISNDSSCPREEIGGHNDGPAWLSERVGRDVLTGEGCIRAESPNQHFPRRGFTLGVCARKMVTHRRFN